MLIFSTVTHHLFSLLFSLIGAVNLELPIRDSLKVRGGSFSRTDTLFGLPNIVPALNFWFINTAGLVGRHSALEEARVPPQAA